MLRSAMIVRIMQAHPPQQTRHDMNKHSTNAQDFAAAQAVVLYALRNDWLVSVFDGEAWALKQSADQDAILEAMGSTDCDTLRFRERNTQTRLFDVMLVWGNNGECYADASYPADMTARIEAFDNEIMPQLETISYDFPAWQAAQREFADKAAQDRADDITG